MQMSVSWTSGTNTVINSVSSQHVAPVCGFGGFLVNGTASSASLSAGSASKLRATIGDVTACDTRVLLLTAATCRPRTNKNSTVTNHVTDHAVCRQPSDLTHAMTIS
jgi:hypothetical protein